jgi:hypothetical protein
MGQRSRTPSTQDVEIDEGSHDGRVEKVFE